MKLSPITPVYKALAVKALVAMLWFTCSPARALTWNWSFQGLGSTPEVAGSGQLVTDGTSYQAATTYNITGISGTFTYNNLVPPNFVITGLDPLGNPTPTLQWNGTPSSPLLLNNLGIDFTVIDLAVSGGVSTVEINYLAGINPSIYGAADRVSSPSITGSVLKIINSSSLSPAGASAVPGPAPLLGAAAAFSWSRRLRRRVISKEQP